MNRDLPEAAARPGCIAGDVRQRPARCPGAGHRLRRRPFCLDRLHRAADRRRHRRDEARSARGRGAARCLSGGDVRQRDRLALRRRQLQHRGQQLRDRAYPGQRRRAARDQPRACGRAGRSPRRCPASTTRTFCSARPSSGRWGCPGWARRTADSSTASPTIITSIHRQNGAGGWRRSGCGSKQQTYYFSAAAHRRFDLSHYLGVPSLITKRLLGRWMLFDWQRKAFERWLRPYYEEPLPAVGAYQFVLCRKTG